MKSVTAIVVVAAVMGSPAAATIPQSSDGPREPGRGSSERSAAKATVRTERCAVDPVDADVRDLLAVAGDASLPTVVRARALEPLFRTVSPAHWQELVAAANRWLEEFDNALREGASLADQEPTTPALLAESVAVALASAPDCSGAVRAGPEQRLALLSRVAIGGVMVPGSQRVALDAIEREFTEPAARQRFCLELLAANPASVVVPPQVVRMLAAGGEPALAALRAAVRGSAAEPRGFHHAAAVALVELGDGALVPELLAWAERFDKSASDKAGDAQAGPRAADRLRRYVRLIQAQHPPSGLLSLIGAQPELVNRDNERAWALRKASERGVPAPVIRKTLMDYAAVMEREWAGRLQGRAWPGSMQLKRVAMEVGVLSESDWPNVPVSVDHAEGACGH